MMSWITRRAKSFGYAFAGLVTLVKTQPNAQLHMLATALVIAAGLALGLSTLEWGLIALAIGGVWATEALNTALEILCDKVEPEHHPAIKQVKDVAAAGVLLVAAAALVVGALVFLPKLCA